MDSARVVFGGVIRSRRFFVFGFGGVIHSRRFFFSLWFFGGVIHSRRFFSPVVFGGVVGDWARVMIGGFVVVQEFYFLEFAAYRTGDRLEFQAYDLD